MTGKLDHLERVVDGEVRLLAELPPVVPAAGVVARVRAAVRAEAARFGPPVTGLPSLSRWAAIAAALLLAAGLSGVLTGSYRTGEQFADAAELLALWADALGDSSDRLAFLLEDGWMIEAASGENGTAVDGILDSLESSLEEFGTS